MDSELYEEAVRDYEKVYQTEKTSGELLTRFSDIYNQSTGLTQSLCFRTQTSTEKCTVGAEEEQEERLLQGARSW